MRKNTILIIESAFHHEIVSTSRKIVENFLRSENFSFKIFTVPGALEIPSAMNIILEEHQYAGVIALGCLIQGATNNNVLIAHEGLRLMLEIATNYTIPFGYGVITANTLDEATERAESYGINAANACVSLIKLKRECSTISHDSQFDDLFTN